MSDDTQLANLLLTMQSSIRTDIRDSEGRVCARIDDVRAKQGEHDLRLTALEERARSTALLDLTPRQKKLLVTAAGLVGAAVLEGLSHVFRWVPSVVSAFTNGVRQ